MFNMKHESVFSFPRSNNSSKYFVLISENVFVPICTDKKHEREDERKTGMGDSRKQ